MGLVYASIELTNADDEALVKRHIIDADEVRKINVEMLVDSGSLYLVINEDIQSFLQLPFIEKKRAVLANDMRNEYDLVGPVRVSFEGKVTYCEAVVMPGSAEPLLGAIPMEGMHVYIHPSTQQLVRDVDKLIRI
jgi:clan AA aspartic protease